MLQYRVKIINFQQIDLFYTVIIFVVLVILDGKVLSDKNFIHSYILAYKYQKR